MLQKQKCGWTDAPGDAVISRSCPTKMWAEVMASPRPFDLSSVFPHYSFRAHLGNPSGDFFHISHPLGGVDVPFVCYDLSSFFWPTSLGLNRFRHWQSLFRSISRKFIRGYFHIAHTHQRRGVYMLLLEVMIFDLLLTSKISLFT